MTLYRIIYYDQEALRNGAKTEPVSYVGSHPLTWHESDVPEVGFVEMTQYEIEEYLAEEDNKLIEEENKIYEKMLNDTDSLLARTKPA